MRDSPVFIKRFCRQLALAAELALRRFRTEADKKLLRPSYRS
jgi:hypothetical protein